MEPVFLDLHIHTSKNPESLDPDYDIDKLKSKITKYTSDSTFLISITDHNTINKPVYLTAKDKIDHLLLGVELHIQNYEDAPAYHCHIYFDTQINEDIIDDLNKKLDELYPQKVVKKNDKQLPKIEKIINTFDSYNFLLLPHGGQSHCTFDSSIPEGVKFDSTLERSIYYNQFDGFTARGNSGLDRTQDYFKRLGIHEFVNLVTCTDNYNPENYPNPKSSEAGPFVPTWMFALPTFNGLRLSLSERSRLVYSEDKPNTWSEHLQSVKLVRENIDIDVELTSGLNVVIGGSSSGKTLFVDSVYNKIGKDFEDSKYLNFSVDDIQVENPAGITPHYLSQNYIISVLNEVADESIGQIDIVKNVFPGDESIRDEIDKGLRKLKSDLKELVKSIKIIDKETDKLKRIPKLSRLVLTKDVRTNILDLIKPMEYEYKDIEYSSTLYQEHIDTLDQIDAFLKLNPLVERKSGSIKQIKDELKNAFDASNFESKIREIIKDEKNLLDESLKAANLEDQTKKQNFEKVIKSIKKYSKAYLKFKKALKTISEYSTSYESEEIESMGHKLSIQNDFELNSEKFLDTINHYLKKPHKIDSFAELTPESLFQKNFKKRSPKVHDYDDFEQRVYAKFEELNQKTYKITTSEGKNFENLSAGWQTSVLLDLILGYQEDIAPIIIDQPEDNLATRYINEGLVEAIKKIKSKKQVILVSHNATIPMLGDAQNVILCRNREGKILIRSSRLEGKIGTQNVLDFIASITDGGKSSVKKRVKKYNLKNFK